MSKEKRHLPVLEEITVIQKEPGKQQEILPSIDIQELLSKGNKDLDEPLPSIPQQLVNPLLGTLPGLVDEGQFNRPLNIINQPPLILDETQQYADDGNFTFANKEHVNFYNQLITTIEYYSEPVISPTYQYQENEYTSYSTNMQWNFKGINYFGTQVLFTTIRSIATSPDFAANFIATSVNKPLFELFKFDKKQFQVFEVKNTTTDIDFFEYFKRLFGMFNVLKNVNSYTGNENKPQLNTTHVDLCWNTYKLNEFFVSRSNPSLGKKFNIFTLDILYVNIYTMTLISSFNGKIRYFQVKFIRNIPYLITNAFEKEISDDPLPLPSPEQSYLYTMYPQKMDEVQLTRERMEEEPENEELPIVTYLTEEFKGTKRSIAIRELTIVDFTFNFSFPEALAYRNPISNEILPIYFHEIHGLGTINDTVMFTLESWPLLRDFILTILFPEQCILPPAQGDDQTIQEEVIEQIENPQRITLPQLSEFSQSSQGFLPTVS